MDESGNARVLDAVCAIRNQAFVHFKTFDRELPHTPLDQYIGYAYLGFTVPASQAYKARDWHSACGGGTLKVAGEHRFRMTEAECLQLRTKKCV